MSIRLDEYINKPHSVYTRSLEITNNKRKKHHHPKKIKKKSKKNRRLNKKHKNKQKGFGKPSTSRHKPAVKKKTTSTLSINTNIVNSTYSITTNSEESQPTLATSTDKMISSITITSTLSPTVAIKPLPTTANHDTHYIPISVLTATPIHIATFSLSTTSRNPEVTPSANFNAEISNDDGATTEGYKAVPGAHKLALGLCIGFGCLAIIGLVTLFIQNYKKRQRINHHSPTDIGNFFSEKPRLSPSLNNVSTKWRPNSFLGVVASVVARLPSSRSSGSVVNMGNDALWKNSVPLNPSPLRKTYINETFNPPYID